LVHAADFDKMRWVQEHLWPDAVVYNRTHAANAIRELSSEPPVRYTYAHLGLQWHKDKMLYLHSGGAIDASGSRDDIEVNVPAPLQPYRLPSPIAGEELRQAIQASLELLSLVPDDRLLPLLAGVFRSTLGPCPFDLLLCGPTNSLKTELASLFSRFFGSGLKADALPASGDSTANGTRALGAVAPNTTLVIDDLVTTGTRAENKLANDVLRPAANQTPRLRATGQGHLGETTTVQALVLATGEQLPSNESLIPRLVLIELNRGAVDLDLLTQCQSLAASGTYASVMASFLQWVVARDEQVETRLQQEMTHLREQLVAELTYPKLAEALAHLEFGFRLFCEFGMEKHALSQEDAQALQQRCRHALLRQAQYQELSQRHQDPAEQYIDCLAQALARGQAHLTQLDGQAPPEPGRCGWQLDQRGGWMPVGKHLGYTRGESIYLKPGTAFEAAKRCAQACRTPFHVSEQTLRKRRFDQGYLESTEYLSHGTYTIRVSLPDGRRPYLLHLRRQDLTPDATMDDPGQDGLTDAISFNLGLAGDDDGRAA
jgi:hypothetical protein